METYFKEARLLRDLNRALDDDYQKLSDKYKNLQLSHNRKKNALNRLHEFFHDMKPQMLYASDLFYINKWINDALFSDGRVNERSVVKQKKKGGAK